MTERTAKQSPASPRTNRIALECFGSSRVRCASQVVLRFSSGSGENHAAARYGVLYAPAINTEEPIFFGDEKKFLDAGWGQQTDTFIVGYECAHLFWSDNEKCVR